MLDTTSHHRDYQADRLWDARGRAALQDSTPVSRPELGRALSGFTGSDRGGRAQGGGQALRSR